LAEATVARRGPLRVRALVRVRWPRTRQAALVALAAVASQVDQALDVHRYFAAQVALDRVARDLHAQRVELGLR